MTEQNTAPSVPHEGVEKKMGGKLWIIPALSLKQIKRLIPIIQQIDIRGDALKPESMDAAVQVVHAALSRNYPDVTLDDVEDMVDMRNIVSVVEAVMGVAGLERKGEA